MLYWAPAFPVQGDRQHRPLHGHLQGFRGKTAGIRRPGAAALDLAYVACGRFDGFFEFGLHAWDMAAGALIAREAGAIVADADGSENYSF